MRRGLSGGAKTSIYTTSTNTTGLHSLLPRRVDSHIVLKLGSTARPAPGNGTRLGISTAPMGPCTLAFAPSQPGIERAMRIMQEATEREDV